MTETMENTLNRQIELEAYASFLYLSMASWCDNQGLAGCAQFMHTQSSEERDHMLRIFHYISEVDGHALTPSIPQAPVEFESIQSMFYQVYEHEKKVTNAINNIVDLCYKENDYSTLNFMQWYIEEQREEEDQMRTILDRIKLIGSGPQALYYIDKEIAAINKAELKAAAAEEEVA
ncbi:MAG: ferritin [Bacteroidota bacterium]